MISEESPKPDSTPIEVKLWAKLEEILEDVNRMKDIVDK